MSERARGVAGMTAAMAISGTIGWFVVVSGQPLVDILFWRCVFGAATLLPVCAAMGFLRGHLDWRIASWSALGGAAIVLNWLLLFASFSHVSISVGTAVYNTQPFMLVALGAFLFREKVTAAALGWLTVSFAGVLLIAQGKDGGGPAGGHYVLGIAMALGAAFLYAVAALVTRKLKGTPPHLIALVQVGVGIVLLAPLGGLEHPPGDAKGWGVMLVMGVVYTGLVYILLYGAIQKLPVRLTGALSFIYPVVAILVDFLAFGHRFSPAQALGCAAILVSAAGMTLGWTPAMLFKRRRAAP